MDWKLILDSLKDGVCITTPYYSLIYLNPALKELLLVKEDPPFHPCYKALFDREEPCPFCPEPDGLREGMHTEECILEPVPVHMRVMVVKDPKKGLLRVATFRDLPIETRWMRGKGHPENAFTKRHHVLLIDDNELLRDMGRDILDHLGYVPILAASGEEGIKLFREKHHRIDLVLLDVVMPGIGGLETFRRLKQIDPKVKVLVVSGYSEAEQVIKILKEGALGLIQKPFQIKVLARAIKEILGEKGEAPA